ncbi:MAG: hypothetical protein ACK5M1_00495 [Xanthomarina gelatinilytica]|uniref:hypothetical protein n=1 Tax=Xanthomarina gelatinilytica TaxID=1137281 RepID=UPI003A85D276
MKKIISLIALMVFGLTQAQTILIVDNNNNIDTSPSHMYNTFNAAIAAASNGDIIYVQPSVTNYGNVNISKEVSVYGMGHTPELNAGRSATFGSITISNSNVKLAGIQSNNAINITGTVQDIIIENNSLNNVYLNSAVTTNLTLQGNIIDGNLGLSPNNNNSVNTTITHNFFETTPQNGISYLNSTTIFNNNIVYYAGVTTTAMFLNPNDLVAQNNIFVSTSSFNGTNWQSGGTPILFNNCMSYSFNGITLGALNGTGNFNNVNPQFIIIPGTNPAFSATNNYNIGATALGTDGNDVGLFNGSFDFDMRGYPTELPYLKEMSISNNMVPAGSNLNVNLKANANKTN